MSNKYVEQFIPLVDAIAETFGKTCEVVLHDLSKPERSIIKIVNGHVTGRSVGGPITDLVLPVLKNNKTDKSFFIGYHTKTKTGKELKSTTVFIKDTKGKIVGALCINIDVTPYLFVKNILEELCITSTLNTTDGDKESPEKFESNVDTLVNELIKETSKKIGKPLPQMGREDKLEMIRNLKEKGIFLIKGSAKRVSKELNVSLATIYKYLEEI
jgi:predicted transcriptional regulator YheO